MYVCVYVCADIGFISVYVCVYVCVCICVCMYVCAYVCADIGFISVDNLQLLCELLEEISRMDLSTKVKEFVHKKESEWVEEEVETRVCDHDEGGQEERGGGEWVWPGGERVDNGCGQEKRGVG